MKFSIGQKVKIIKNESGEKYYDKFIGRVGYIYQINQNDSNPYWVNSKPNRTGKGLELWKASELSLVKTKKEKGWLICSKCGKKNVGLINDICEKCRKPKKEGKIELGSYTYFCYFCRKHFDLDSNLLPSVLKKVYIGEDVVGVCCPKCEYERMVGASSLSAKYPQGYVMRGEDGELRILIDKSWLLVREGDVVDFSIKEVDAFNSTQEEGK